MNKYRILQCYKGGKPWYILEKEKRLWLFQQGSIWVTLFESSSFDECEEYLNSLRDFSPPTVFKEYEF